MEDMGKRGDTMTRLLIVLFLFPSICFAAPALNFSDLISGPATGLGDGQGSGAIITIWGNRLGSSQGTSTLQVCGATPAHIYYWKNADGVLPSGPAELYTTHEMQEIAFSLPASCSNVATTISVTVDGETSNTLPFTVRSGNIYHAMTTGSSSASGSYSDPFDTLMNALPSTSAGDIVYLHHGVEDIAASKHIFSGYTGTEANQRAFVVYPNSTYLIQAPEASVDMYNSNAFVFSKVVSKSGYYTEPDPASTTILGKTGGTGMEGSQNGRLVGNEITEIDGMCSSGYAGAIVASSGGGSYNYTGNLKIFGNYIHDWGCNQTSHFEHTTYISIRNNGAFDVEPWEMGWNHLRDNLAKYGIHNYDETQAVGADLCGSPTGVVKIHDNYVTNQKGAGINVGAKAAGGYDCWDNGSFDIYNNVVIESGKGPADENGYDDNGIRIGDAGMDMPVKVYNNTVYAWGDDALGAGAGLKTYETNNSGRSTITASNNIFYDTRGGSYTGIVETTYTNVSGAKNIFYSSSTASGTDSRLTGSILNAPDFVADGSDFKLSTGSPAIDTGVVGISTLDILSQARQTIDIGAYEYQGAAPLPPVGAAHAQVGLGSSRVGYGLMRVQQ